MQEEGSQAITVRLKFSLYKRTKQAALDAGVSQNALIERAVEAHLQAQEAPRACPECGSWLAYSHNPGCSRRT